jgi:hypothetical protein
MLTVLLLRPLVLPSQAVTRFFRLYEELYDLQCPDYERPTLFIFADLTSTRLSHRQQLDLLKKIGARLQVQTYFHAVFPHKRMFVHANRFV